MNKNAYYQILIVDDEPANIFLLEGLLTAKGYNVVSKLNGTEALQYLETTLPDLILLDIMMPEISGIDVLKSIVSNKRLSHIPVIMVSAKSESEDVEEALDAGAVEYIKKPINEIELMARIRTVLRLKKKEDELKIMLKSKEDFINMVSHDVRTPFISISSFAELLLSDKKLIIELDQQQKEFLHLIISTSNYLYEYFNKLLNWSNIASSELQLIIENVKLSKLIHTSVLVLKSKIEEKKIIAQYSINENIIVNVDIIYFSQVITNLLSNAIKYTPENGSINISAEKTNNNVILKIADSGMGIEPFTKDDIFNPQTYHSIRGTKGEKGTGIGLKICKKILDAHHFKMDLESEKGKGTTFFITI